MTTHIWGDAWFIRFGDDLSAAMNLIYTKLNKHSLKVSLKEKYGTIRYEHIFNEDFTAAPYEESWSLLWDIVREVIVIYPYLADELVEDIAGREEVVGEQIHNAYWTSV